ncbi:hypothetical protein ACFPOI_28070 [Nonomuraea angiospora]|uniref:MarR family transcriptional regulator n=1 Tax=Nonomuraea angiospora TaxID=46172 RepID=A0ABR9LN99_9ACTN|nr:hypothetical protein [Nonomuraea angiospora]MBE1582123.1 hypothetical protein [Nonomuraea angiospora]
MQDARPSRTDVASALHQLSTLMQGIYLRVSERHDLTPVQARLLCVLLDGLVAPLAPDVRERFGDTMAEIIEKCRASGCADQR